MNLNPILKTSPTKRKSKFKTSLKMKITGILLLAVTMQVCATGMAQKVSLTFKNDKLLTVFREIEKQTNYSFVYGKEQLTKAQNITISIQNEKLETALELIFKNQPMTYTLEGNHVILKKRSDFANLSEIIQPIQLQISGKVTDENGLPLAGANVLLKGTKKTVLTQDDGSFEIQIPSYKSTLVISFTGFISREIILSEGENAITVQLKEENKTLDEVVVVGYGSQKKGSLTGAVSSINGAALVKSSTPNVSNTLVGRVAGVIANNRSGRPGDDNATILIRGINSFGGGTGPLVVIDGIPDRDLSRMNPADIETVTVLKDASAAIYGVRSANGVILVTTKRGKLGKPTIQYDGSYGIQQLTRMTERVNSWQYMTYYNELNVNKGNAAPYAQADIDKYKAGNVPNYTSTDWMKAVFRQNAPQSTQSLSVSGGTEDVKYYLSGQYLNQESNFRNSDELFKQYNLRSNIDVKISNNLKVNFDLAGRRESRVYPSASVGSILHETVSMYPFIPDYYANGLPSAGIANGRNPVIMTSSAAGYDKIQNLILNPKIGFELKMPYVTKGFSVSGYAAFDYALRSEKRFTKPWDAYSYDKTTDTYNNQKASTAISSVTQDEFLSNENTYFFKAAYDRQFDKHEVNAFLGYEQTTNINKRTTAYRRDLLSDQLDQIFTGSTVAQDANGFEYQDGRESYLGRVAYNYDGKYFAEVSARYNGSFNFPTENRWGMFPALSLGWKISNEDFFKDNIKIVDQFKIRASWGKMGNDAIAQYLFMTRYQLNTIQEYNVYFGDYTQATNLYLSSTPNPNITWENQDTKDIGFDASFLDNKLKVGFDYFHYVRSDILAARSASVPQYTGLVLPPENIGKSQNHGVDIAVSYAGGTTDFKYNVGLNFTYAKSKVIFRDESPNIPEWQRSTGEAIDSWLVYKTNGIYRSQADVDASPHLEGAAPGDLWLKDIDNDGSITSNDKVRIPESATPKIVYGIPMGCQYKGFGLDILWTGQTMAKQMILPQAQGSIIAPPTWLYEGRYTAENPNAPYPRAFNSTDSRNNVPADFWLKDASFLRLKSLEVSYVLPKNILNKLGVTNFRFYVGGSNLFSIDKMKKYNVDPETNNTTGINYPQVRIYRFGLNIGL